MVKPYEQDVILDVSGKPVFDAMAIVQTRIDQFSKTLRELSSGTVKDVKNIQKIVDANIKALKQARSDLRALQEDKVTRSKAFDAVEKKARDAELRARRAEAQLDKQRLIEAKRTYSEIEKAAKRDADVQKQLAREVAQYEAELDRQKIASSRRVAAARQEAAQARITARARGITDIEDASRSKADSDARLRNLRREREAVAATDAEATRGLAARIALEKTLGRELDNVIRKLERQRTLAESRMSGAAFQGNKLLAGARVRDSIVNSGGDTKGALLGLQFQQELARKGYEAALASRTPDLQAIQIARQKLELANAEVAAAKRLHAEKEKQVAADRKLRESERKSDHAVQVRLAGVYAREQINALGPARALAEAKARTAEAEERLANASRRTRTEAERALQLAKAQEKEINKQGTGNPISNILSPRYAAAAFMRTSVYGLAAMGAYGVFNAVGGSATSMVEFEDELAKLSAIAGATEPQMVSLANSILQIGSNSRFSIIDLTKISQTLAQAGVTASEMSDVLKSVTTLANASGSTPDEAVNLVTSALGSFQLQASEAARVADLMTSALNRTKLTVAQVGQAIQYVGSTAYEQNISLEQMLATVGAIAQAGVRSGSTIGTGFRQFLVDLQNPSEKLTEQLEALGLTSRDVDVTVRGLPAVLDTLRNAGFGASQAYEGLETRAAAFYLTAKNNVDIMDQLQLSFAFSGAAAEANEKAMNSLTAQWQRFQNVLTDMSSGLAGDVIGILTSTIRTLSDGIQKLNEYTRTGAGPRTAGQSATSIGGYTAAGAAAGAGVGAIFGGIGAVPGALVGGGAGFFGGVYKELSRTTEATKDFATATAEANENVERQIGRMSELDKELQRLNTQKASLRENDARSAAEMASLMSRFDGLALYIKNTGNRYDDLVQAMERYRLKQMELMDMELASQQSALTQQFAEERGNKRKATLDILSNPANRAQLTPRELQAVQNMQRLSDRTSSGELRRGFASDAAMIADAATRLVDKNPALSESLNNLTQATTGLAQAAVGLNVATARRENNRAAQTPLGKEISDLLRDAGAAVPQLRTLGDAEQKKEADKLLKRLARYEGIVNERLPRVTSGGNKKFLQDSLLDIRSFTQQVNAILKPSKKEIKEAEREANRVEPRAKVTQADLDKILRDAGLGDRFGSGVRSAAEQNRLKAQGATRLGAEDSSHSNGSGARDISVRGMSQAEINRTVTMLQSKLRSAGIDAQVIYETGKGKNQGTGAHIHVGVRKGARFTRDRTTETEAAYNGSLDQNQLELDQQALSQSLKQMAKATTQETFQAALRASSDALEKVQNDLRNAAENELAAKGVSKNDPEYAIRMRQVEQSIQQNIDAYQQSIADALVKSLTNMMKDAQLSFEQSIQGAEQFKAMADARLSGLGYQSNAGRVPDFMRELLQQRAGAASEQLDRSRAAALPALIDRQQAAINEKSAQLSNIQRYDADGVETAAYQSATQAIEAQVQALARLRQEKAALDAGLAVSAQFPKTLAEGLNQAIEAYRGANAMNSDFTTGLIMNLGGAIQMIDQGLTDMFTGIFTGSQNALQAFANFARGIMNWMGQLVAKIIATKLIELLFSVVGGGISPSLSSTPATGAASFSPGAAPGRMNFGVRTLRFNGGPVYEDFIRRAGGGSVDNGSTTHDSVNAKLAKGEWVIRKAAVDSVGNEFMAQLNQHGSKALEGLQSMPKINMKNRTETNVYVVPPEQRPSLGRDDVLVILHDDMINGSGRRLVQHIAKES